MGGGDGDRFRDSGSIQVTCILQLQSQHGGSHDFDSLDGLSGKRTEIAFVTS